MKGLTDKKKQERDREIKTEKGKNRRQKKRLCVMEINKTYGCDYILNMLLNLKVTVQSFTQNTTVCVCVCVGVNDSSSAGETHSQTLHLSQFTLQMAETLHTSLLRYFCLFPALLFYLPEAVSGLLGVGRHRHHQQVLQKKRSLSKDRERRREKKNKTSVSNAAIWLLKLSAKCSRKTNVKSNDAQEYEKLPYTAASAYKQG